MRTLEQNEISAVSGGGIGDALISAGKYLMSKGAVVPGATLVVAGTVANAVESSSD